METIAWASDTKARKEHKCMFCCQPIPKGTTYLNSTHKYEGTIYDWKTHKHCGEIADKLAMYNNCDEGVTTESFIEHIKEEYQNIMSSTQTEIYESKAFVYQVFADQLLFVVKHHGIEI